MLPIASPIALQASGVLPTMPAAAPQTATHIPGQTDGASFSFHLPKPVEHIQAPSLPVESGAASEPASWGHLVQQMVRDVNQTQVGAGEKVRDVLMGGKTQVHEEMIAMQEANLSFSVLSEMRNKAIEGYQEIMRMQV
jgi:flagellar hook-basal body complex protein FliE